MRILHVAPTYLPAIRYGGPILAVHGLCRALAARGHAVEVLTTSIDGGGDSDVPHGDPVMLDGVIVRYFRSPVLRRLAWAPGMREALRAGVAGADIVHLHSAFLWPTWAGARHARMAETPYIVSPRGMLARPLIAARHRLIKTVWIRLIETANLEGAAAVHVTSQAEATALAELRFRLRRVVTIANGLDDDAPPRPGQPVSPDIAALAERPPLVLFLGRLSRVKGLDRLLHAFSCTRVGTLAIVGADYDGIGGELARLAEALGIADRVRFVTRTVTGADKEFAFAAASAAVLPSRFESFGNAALEAMLRGLPVVVTPEVGVADIVRRSGGGTVAAPEPAPLGAALERLLAAPDLARSMGAAGRDYVRRHYRWAIIAAEMEGVYAGLVMPGRRDAA